MGRNSRNKLTEQFIAHSREMRESPAWRYLPDNARRILDRLELEHMHHGGAENGCLPCTYSDFVRAGLRRASISLAIRQAEALGFLEVTHRGGRAISDARWPSRYRLTYVLGGGKSTERTDDWKRIKTTQEALSALGLARDARNRDTQPTKGIKSRTIVKFKKPDAETELRREAQKRNSNATGAGRENGTPVSDAKTELPSISRPGGTSSANCGASQTDTSEASGQAWSAASRARACA